MNRTVLYRDRSIVRILSSFLLELETFYETKALFFVSGQTVIDSWII